MAPAEPAAAEPAAGPAAAPSVAGPLYTVTIPAGAKPGEQLTFRLGCAGWGSVA